MKQITIRNYLLKELSSVAQIANDETRGWMHKTTLLKLNSGAIEQVTTNGHIMVLVRHESNTDINSLVDQLKELGGNIEEGIILHWPKRINCKKSESTLNTKIILGKDISIVQREYAQYLKVIPSGESKALNSIGLGAPILKQYVDICKMYDLHGAKFEFFGDLKPIVVTPTRTNRNIKILVMPLKL